MMEKKNRFEKQAVGDADMTDDVVNAAAAALFVLDSARKDQARGDGSGSAKVRDRASAT